MTKTAYLCMHAFRGQDLLQVLKSHVLDSFPDSNLAIARPHCCSISLSFPRLPAPGVHLTAAHQHQHRHYRQPPSLPPQLCGPKPDQTSLTLASQPLCATSAFRRMLRPLAFTPLFSRVPCLVFQISLHPTRLVCTESLHIIGMR